MINEQTVDILRKMKLNAMANELMNQLNDSNTYNSLGFEERIKSFLLIISLKIYSAIALRQIFP